MGTDAPERTYDIHSKRDATGQTYLGDARLLLGNGAIIEFKHGVAEKIPESAVDLIRHRSDLVFLPNDDGPPAAAVPTSEPPAAPPEPPEPPTVPSPALVAVDPAVLAAQEHLRAEGLDVPDPDVAKVAPDAPTEALIQLRPGFEATTASGERRCLAAKADGTQCKNEATEGTWACGMGAHVEQIAELQQAVPPPAS